MIYVVSDLYDAVKIIEKNLKCNVKIEKNETVCCEYNLFESNEYEFLLEVSGNIQSEMYGLLAVLRSLERKKCIKIINIKWKNICNNDDCGHFSHSPDMPEEITFEIISPCNEGEKDVI
jgi:hypothetical protein